ncbi:MAG: hypothetical protein J6Y37_10920 [Paludibacteraceae bacterium]|nr:hypothetical protein [Paludibacteraceae bacterium]
MLKKSFFNTIIGAFVEITPDEQPNMVEVAKQPASQPANYGVSVDQGINVSADGSIQGTVDNNLLEKICEFMEQSNLPGPDYIELMKAAQNDVMKSAIPDESARYMAAYITMKANAPQLDRNVVLGSIDKYVELIEGQRSEALNQLHSVWVEAVEKPEKEVEEAQSEISSLQSRLQELIRFVSDKKAEIGKAKNEQTIRKANYNHTFDTFIGKLNADRGKLDAILVD